MMVKFQNLMILMHRTHFQQYQVTSAVISPMTEITKVSHNNTGMYTKDSSQQTFKISHNNFDVRFERAYQNHNNEIVQTRF